MLVDNLVVHVLAAVEKSYTPQLTMQGIIDSFDRFVPHWKIWLARALACHSTNFDGATIQVDWDKNTP